MSIKHIVREGETLRQVADLYGVSENDILDEVGNESLATRSCYLAKGMTLWIPDFAPKEVDSDTGSAANLEVQKPREVLRIVLKDPAGARLTNVGCTFTFIGSRPQVAVTDGNGIVRLGNKDGLLPRVTGGCKGATIKIGKRTLTLRFDAPPSSKTGKPPKQQGLRPLLDKDGKPDPAAIKSRLKNLGYLIPRVAGDMDVVATTALAAFQADEGLEPTGRLFQSDGVTQDTTTLDKLKELHGC